MKIEWNPKLILTKTEEKLPLDAMGLLETIVKEAPTNTCLETAALDAATNIDEVLSWTED